MHDEELSAVVSDLCVECRCTGRSLLVSRQGRGGLGCKIAKGDEVASVPRPWRLRKFLWLQLSHFHAHSDRRPLLGKITFVRFTIRVLYTYTELVTEITNGP